MSRERTRRARMNGTVATLLLGLLATLGTAQEEKRPAPRPEFPPLAQVIDGYEEVVSTADGAPSLFKVWTREKDGQMLAALPRGFDKKRFFIALTISSGEDYAGLQAGDLYVYWRRYDKRLALVEPNVQIRSTGDQESKDSIKRLYTDRVLLDMPIVSTAGSAPVIDMDALLVGQASRFFRGLRVSNPRLIKIVEAKAFPHNVELAFEVPTITGRLQTLHYSISEIPRSTGYRPRKADTRVGYFVTSYSDYGKFEDSETRVRFINRWDLKKADPDLELSPPQEPIKFYIEHTTPVRYRRWIKRGIEYWNQAFEKVGISGAIEVYYQDKRSGAHMEKDPEDVRYNFVRWLSNNRGTAIGPSRVHPETGQILDADIILTDGWIRHYWTQFHQVMPELALEGVSPRTLAWFGANPQWDPRILLASPAQREGLRRDLAERARQPYAGHPALQAHTDLIGDEEFDGLAGRTSQLNGGCTLARGRAFDVGLFRMLAALAADANAPADANEPNEPNAPSRPAKVRKDESLLDGIPERFIGPLVADLVCHEVGHTLGLRHNFKASGLYTMAEINSDTVRGTQPMAASVMDYLPVNINFKDGTVQGDYAMIAVGPYDEWAIQYGYSQSSAEAKKVLERVAEPALAYATDEDTWGPDPLARRYDLSKNPLDYARSQLRLAAYNRDRIIDGLVKDGDSWAKTRQFYEMTLFMQVRALSTVANWLGGAFIHRDKKGDPGDRLPIEVVPVETQRDALRLLVETGFRDETYGLTPDLLRRMSVDKWWDDTATMLEESTWPVHDMVMGIQSSLLVRILDPTTLGRIYDNEFLIPADEEALTLPELLDTVTAEIWSELKTAPTGTYTARRPLISSLRRNLQRQHVSLLTDLSGASFYSTAAGQAVGDLVMEQMRRIQRQVEAAIATSGAHLDAYSQAHLRDIQMRIERTLKAQMVVSNL